MSEEKDPVVLYLTQRIAYNEVRTLCEAQKLIIDRLRSEVDSLRREQTQWKLDLHGYHKREVQLTSERDVAYKETELTREWSNGLKREMVVLKEMLDKERSKKSKIRGSYGILERSFRLDNGVENENAGEVKMALNDLRNHLLE